MVIHRFFRACRNGHKEIVEQLIKTNEFTSLNEKNNYGDTPFLWACRNGHKEIVELVLIKTNEFTSLNEKNNYGNTPFQFGLLFMVTKK